VAHATHQLTAATRKTMNKASLDKLAGELNSVAALAMADPGLLHDDAPAAAFKLAVSKAMVETFDAYPSVQESREFVLVASPCPGSWESVKRFFQSDAATHAAKAAKWADDIAKATRPKAFFWLDTSLLCKLDLEFERDLVLSVLRTRALNLIAMEDVLRPSAPAATRRVVLHSAAGQFEFDALAMDDDGGDEDCEDGDTALQLRLTGRVAARGVRPVCASFVYALDLAHEGFESTVTRLCTRGLLAELDARDLFLMPVAPDRVVVARASAAPQLDWHFDAALESGVQPTTTVATSASDKPVSTPLSKTALATPRGGARGHDDSAPAEAFSTPAAAPSKRVLAMRTDSPQPSTHQPSTHQPPLQPPLQPPQPPAADEPVAHRVVCFVKTRTAVPVACQAILSGLAAEFSAAELRAALPLLVEQAKSGRDLRLLEVCAGVLVAHAGSAEEEKPLKWLLSRMCIQAVGAPKGDFASVSDFVSQVLVGACTRKTMRRTLTDYLNDTAPPPALPDAAANSLPLTAATSTTAAFGAATSRSALADAQPAAATALKRPKFIAKKVDPLLLNHFVHERLSRPDAIKLDVPARAAAPFARPAPRPPRTKTILMTPTLPIPETPSSADGAPAPKRTEGNVPSVVKKRLF